MIHLEGDNRMVIDVEFYELPDGTEPVVRKFLESLEPKMHAKMQREAENP
jgi:hypothetical protein